MVVTVLVLLTVISPGKPLYSNQRNESKSNGTKGQAEVQIRVQIGKAVNDGQASQQKCNSDQGYPYPQRGKWGKPTCL